MCLFNQFGQRLGPVFQAIKRGHQTIRLRVCQGRALGHSQERLQFMQQRSIVGMCDVLTAEVFQFFEIKPGWGAADSLKREPLGGLRAGEKLIIAMAPAQTGQIVTNARGRVAHDLIFFQSDRAVPL